MSSTVKNNIIKGSFWTLVSNIGTHAITFLVTAVLARLLTPSDFGIVAISAFFTGIISLFQDLGMGAAIIQRQNIDDDYLSTSFLASFLAGVALAGLVALASPFIAGFYGEQVLKPLLLVSSLGFILSPFTSIHLSILTKRLEFRKITTINVATQASSGAISIAFALAGYGVWALVLGRIITLPLMAPFVWKMAGWVPRPALVRKCFNDLFGYSWNLLAFNFLNYFARNLDNLIIGKVLGPQTLGYYSVSYNLMLKPLQLVSWSFGKVLFPVFSSMQDDRTRTREIYLKVLRTISLITFPMMTGLAMVAEEFVLAVYGEQWRPAILPLRLLCLVGAVQSIGTTGGVIFNSHGRPDLTLKLGVVGTALCITAFIAGIKIWGLLGLIIGYITVTIPLFFIGQFFANRLIGIDMAKVLRALAPAALCSGLMVAVLTLLDLINGMALNLDIRLALVSFIVLGAASYVFFAKLLNIPELGEALDLVRKRL